MEMVLEQEEVVALVIEGLQRRGIEVPEGAQPRFRPNNKEQTYRLVFVTPSACLQRKRREP